MCFFNALCGGLFCQEMQVLHASLGVSLTSLTVSYQDG